MGQGVLGLCRVPVMSCVCLCLHSSEKDRPVIHVFDGHGNNKEIALLDSLHSSPLTFMEVWQHGGMAWRYGSMEVWHGGMAWRYCTWR